MLVRPNALHRIDQAGARPTDGLPPAAQSELRRVQRALRGFKRVGRFLSDDELLPYLFLLRGDVVRLETAGEWTQGEFIWRRIADVVRVAWSRTAPWEHLRKAIGPDAPDAAVLRLNIVDEALIDSHLALLTGLTATGPTAESIAKSKAHLYWIARWSERSAMNADERRELVSSLSSVLVTWLLESNRITEAIELVDNLVHELLRPLLVQHDTERLCGVLAQLRVIRVVRQLGGRRIDALKKEELAPVADELRRVAAALEPLVQKHPETALVYQSLGETYRLLAITENVLSQYSDALLHLAMSRACLLDWPDYDRYRAGIEDNLRYVANEFAKIEAQLRANPQATLSAAGQALRVQVQMGAKRAAEYERSPEADRRKAAALHAARLAVSRELGVSASDAALLERVCRSLGDAAKLVRAQAPEDSLRTLWSGVSAGLVLSPQQTQRVVDVLKRASMGELRLSTTAPVQEVDNVFVIRPPGPEIGDRIGGIQCSGTGGSKMEPFWRWLFSPEGVAAKVCFVASVAALAGAGWLWADQAGVVARRGELFDSIVGASPNDDPAPVLDAAAAYYGAEPRKHDLGREQQVKDVYRRSLAAWIAQNLPTDRDLVAQRIDRYRDDVTPHPENDP